MKVRWLTILFAFFILLIIVLADAGKLGILAIVYHVPFADKAGHFMLYGILILLINLTLFRSVPSERRKGVALVSSLVLALLIGLEELSQQHFSSRTFDLVDLSASYLGVMFFSWVALRSQD